MPVDPQIQALLDKGTGVPATHTLPVDVARAQYEARIALMASPAEIADVREQTIDGPGGPLRIRIYTPHGTGPFPLLVFFHGSGFVLCSLDTHEGMCRNLPVRDASSPRSIIVLRPSTNFPPGSRIVCMRHAGPRHMPPTWVPTQCRSPSRAIAPGPIWRRSPRSECATRAVRHYAVSCCSIR
jgi:hypothetical protein